MSLNSQFPLHQLLTAENLRATACGKTILVGEHSVVYNYKAIAMALPSIQLEMTLEKCEKINQADSWENGIKIYIHEKETKPESRVLKILLQAFETALKLLGMNSSLASYPPQNLIIRSKIPLGGGMGGSAAISTCFVRIASQILKKTLTLQEEIFFANEVDSLFHNGKASGLDVSAVASNGIIAFQKNSPVHFVKNKCHFWLALIDSEERSETAEMIKKVKKEMDENPKKVESIFQNLNHIADEIEKFLNAGKILDFAMCLNQAHTQLQSLGVSTPKMDQIVLELMKTGALGAKLTGAGGGGLILAVFSEHPSQLKEKFPKINLYLTSI